MSKYNLRKIRIPNYIIRRNRSTTESKSEQREKTIDLTKVDMITLKFNQKKTLSILNEHTKILNEHTKILTENTSLLREIKNSLDNLNTTIANFLLKIGKGNKDIDKNLSLKSSSSCSNSVNSNCTAHYRRRSEEKKRRCQRRKCEF